MAKTFTVRLHGTQAAIKKAESSKASKRKNWSFNDRRARMLTSPLKNVEFVQLPQD